MPVEFALRPRIRLREGFAPPRRPWLRVPRFVLPVLAYWLGAAGIVYAFVHKSPDGTAQPAAEETATAPSPVARPERAWWEPTPAPEAATESPRPQPQPTVEEAANPRSPAPEQAPAPETPIASEREPAPAARTASKPPETEPAARIAAPPKDRTLAPLALAPRLQDREPTPEAPIAPPPAHTAPAAHGSLPSCEAAAANANQDVDFSAGNRGADLPTSAIAAVLENGAWLSSCSPPSDMSLDVCVAIQGGNVVGVSVTTRPGDANVNACVARRAATLQFPYSPRLDLARTRF